MYQRRIPPHHIVTPEFARQLAELSTETGRQIGALIDRKGYVEYVIVGDARVHALEGEAPVGEHQAIVREVALPRPRLLEIVRENDR